MRSKKKFSLQELSQPEVDVLAILWDSPIPMGRKQLIESLDNAQTSIQGSYISPLLKAMLDKGYIEVVGKVKSGKRYARLFAPVITREEYQQYLFGKLFKTKQPGEHLIAGLVSVQDNPEGYIDALYKQIEEIRAKMHADAEE